MLRLRIVSDHRASMGGNAEKTLHGGDLTVGRGVGNGWILPDPDLLLSRQHCVFAKSGGQYRVTDTSANGVFLNGSDQPLGRDRSATLSPGDRVRIGRFIVEVMMDSVEAPSFTEIAGAFPFGKGGSSPDPFAPALERRTPAFDDDAFGGGGFGSGGAARPFEHQPLRSDEGGFDSWTASNSGGAAGGGSGREDWRFGTVDDHSNAMNQALSITPVGQPFPPPLDPPRPSTAPGAIPDDWDDEMFAPAPSTPRAAPPPVPAPPVQALPEDWNIDETLPDYGEAARAEPAAAPAAAQPAPLPFPIDEFPDPDPSVVMPVARPAVKPDVKPDVTMAPTAAAPVPPVEVPAAAAPSSAPIPSPDAALAAFYQGLGATVPDEGVPDPVALMRGLGEALRASLGALHGSLQARSHFKEEFHLERTSFRPAGANPLKQCETLDEAVSVLANPRLRGFLPLPEAVREAASDVQVHHLAYAAALQTALKQVVAKFDPGALSQRLETGLLDSLIPGARKARYWDRYEALYKDLAAELEEDFDRVVGDAIAREYDRFVQGGGGTSG